MACFDDHTLRARKRSCTSNTAGFSSKHVDCGDDAIDAMFDRVQNNAPAQPAWFGSSRASSRSQLDPILHLEQSLFEMSLLMRTLPERDSTTTELHCAQHAARRVRDRCATTGYRILTESTTLIDNAELVLPSVRPRHVPAPIQARSHQACRSIANSLATLSSIVGAPR